MRPSIVAAIALVALLGASAWPATDAKKKLQFTIYEQLVRPNVTFSEFPAVQGTKVTANTILTLGPNITSARIGAGSDIEHNVRVGTRRNDNDYVEIISLQIQNLVLGRTAYTGNIFVIGFINDLILTPQEVAVVGGTGSFRFASGYISQGIIQFYPGGHVSKLDITIVIGE